MEVVAYTTHTSIQTLINRGLDNEEDDPEEEWIQDPNDFEEAVQVPQQAAPVEQDPSLCMICTGPRNGVHCFLPCYDSVACRPCSNAQLANINEEQTEALCPWCNVIITEVITIGSRN